MSDTVVEGLRCVWGGVRDHNGDDAALYQVKVERDVRLADERVRAARERVTRKLVSMLFVSVRSAALVQWLAHYASQNGGWVVAVNPANTSQQCHTYGSRVTHPACEVSVCPKHGVMDRDVNAATNIAARAVPRVAKARVTRAKNRELGPQVPLRTPVARNSLKYPGRDRAKSKPTPKRKNHRLVSRG